MTSLSWLRTVVAVGGLVTAFSLSPGAGTASADSMYTPLINTTCNYGQIAAAAHDHAPTLASLLSYPAAQTWLQQFLAAPVDQRQQRVQELDANPQWQSLLGTSQAQQGAQEVPLVASTCHKY